MASSVAFMYPIKLGVGPTTDFQVKDDLNSYYLTKCLCIDQVRKPQHPLVIPSLIYMH